MQGGSQGTTSESGLVGKSDGPGPQELILRRLAKSQQNWQGHLALGNLASPKANPSPAAGPRSFVSEPGAWGSSWCGVSMRKLRGPYGYRQPLAGCRSGRAGSTWAAGCEGISHPVNEFSEHHSPHLAAWHTQTSRALVDRSRWLSPSAGLGRP